MFIPALLITGIASVKTKFIIGILSLIQIIYLTEVGVIIMKSEDSAESLEAVCHFPRENDYCTAAHCFVCKIFLYIDHKV